jgi:hypothetical protein
MFSKNKKNNKTEKKKKKEKNDKTVDETKNIVFSNKAVIMNK